MKRSIIALLLLPLQLAFSCYTYGQEYPIILGNVGIELSSGFSGFEDCRMTISPGAECNFKQGAEIVSRYKGNTYILEPILPTVHTREPGRFLAGYFRGSIVLLKDPNLTLALPAYCRSPEQIIRKMTTKSIFRRIELDERVYLFTTEGVEGGKIEVLVLGEGSIPLVFNEGAKIQKVERTAFNETAYQAQQRLRQLGYDPGPLDGMWGKKTAIVIKKFQQDNGLSVSGKLDQETINKLKEMSQETEKK